MRHRLCITPSQAQQQLARAAPATILPRHSPVAVAADQQAHAVRAPVLQLIHLLLAERVFHNCSRRGHARPPSALPAATITAGAAGASCLTAGAACRGRSRCLGAPAVIHAAAVAGGGRIPRLRVLVLPLVPLELTPLPGGVAAARRRACTQSAGCGRAGHRE